MERIFCEKCLTKEKVWVHKQIVWKADRKSFIRDARQADEIIKFEIFALLAFALKASV